MTPPSGERADASQTCDRCGPAVRAVYHTRRVGELYLCRHCAYRLWSALSAQGWTIWLLEEDAPTPQPAPTRKTSWWQRS
jgi:ribosomal protein S14